MCCDVFKIPVEEVSESEVTVHGMCTTDILVCTLTGSKYHPLIIIDCLLFL